MFSLGAPHKKFDFKLDNSVERQNDFYFETYRHS